MRMTNDHGRHGGGAGLRPRLQPAGRGRRVGRRLLRGQGLHPPPRLLSAALRARVPPPPSRARATSTWSTTTTAAAATSRPRRAYRWTTFAATGEGGQRGAAHLDRAPLRAYATIACLASPSGRGRARLVGIDDLESGKVRDEIAMTKKLTHALLALRRGARIGRGDEPAGRSASARRRYCRRTRRRHPARPRHRRRLCRSALLRLRGRTRLLSRSAPVRLGGPQLLDQSLRRDHLQRRRLALLAADHLRLSGALRIHARARGPAAAWRRDAARRRRRSRR